MRQFRIIDPKRRLIGAPAFRDRVIHHTLCQVIEPVFEKRFITDSFACRVGRGTHAAMQHIVGCTQQAKRQWGRYYVLKCDVNKFFPSVHHDTLKRIIGRAIRDKKVLHLNRYYYQILRITGTGRPGNTYRGPYLSDFRQYLSRSMRSLPQRSVSDKVLCPVHGRLCDIAQG